MEAQNFDAETMKIFWHNFECKSMNINLILDNEI